MIKLAFLRITQGLLISFAAISFSFAGTKNFLSLSDIHFDPYLSCTQKPCPLIQSLREAPVEQWEYILAKDDTSTIAYGKDSNYPLLVSALKAAKDQAERHKIQFILVLGDFLSHDYDKKYYQYSNDKSATGYAHFVKKTLLFYQAQLKQAFPNTSIYWAVGNNDSDHRDYFQEPWGSFFKDMGATAAPLIQDEKGHLELLSQFPHGGYYALDLPQEPHLRLIVLNSVLFSSKAQGPKLDQAAKQELAWLHQQLEEAAKDKKTVLIAMHIPTGIDVYASLFIPFEMVEFWKKPYSQDFMNEINQHNHILGVFTGHIHVDAFHVYAKGDKLIPFAGTPSISPIYGNSPAFKIYSYSEPAIRLTDFLTYTYSLNTKQWKEGSDSQVKSANNHLRPHRSS